MHALAEHHIRGHIVAMKLAPTPPGSSVTRSQPTFQITLDNIAVFHVSEYIFRSSSGKLAHIPYFETHDDHKSGFYRTSALSQ